MMITTSISLMIHNFDKFFVAGRFSLEELAYYSIAFDVNSKAWLFVYAINGSLYTLLIRRGSRGESQSLLVLISFASVILLAIGYYIPITLLAHPLLDLWISTDFADNAYVLVGWFAVASVLYLFQSVLHNLLTTARRITLLGVVNFFALILLTTLVLVLAEPYGMAGVAGSYSVMYLFMFVALGIGAYRAGLLRFDLQEILGGKDSPARGAIQEKS